MALTTRGFYVNNGGTVSLAQGSSMTLLSVTGRGILRNIMISITNISNGTFKLKVDGVGILSIAMAYGSNYIASLTGEFGVSTNLLTWRNANIPFNTKVEIEIYNSSSTPLYVNEQLFQFLQEV